jgi:hypothetical protein
VCRPRQAGAWPATGTVWWDPQSPLAVTCAQVKGAQILLRTRPDGFPKMGVSLITFNLLPHATVSLLQGLG